MPRTEAEAQSVLHTCFGNEHLSLLKSREGKEIFHKSWRREILLEHSRALKQWGGGGDTFLWGDEGLVTECVSFHHYLQGSPGDGGVPGSDGLKGEKVGKHHILPQRKICSSDVVSQVEHARQVVKTSFRLPVMHDSLTHLSVYASNASLHIFSCDLFQKPLLKVKKRTADIHVCHLQNKLNLSSIAVLMQKVVLVVHLLSVVDYVKNRQSLFVK